MTFPSSFLFTLCLSVLSLIHLKLYTTVVFSLSITHSCHHIKFNIYTYIAVTTWLPLRKAQSKFHICFTRLVFWNTASLLDFVPIYLRLFPFLLTTLKGVGLKTVLSLLVLSCWNRTSSLFQHWSVWPCAVYLHGIWFWLSVQHRDHVLRGHKHGLSLNHGSFL